MRKSILFVVFCILFKFVTAQDAYYKSSIITLSNDTIQGYASNAYDAKSFQFKRNKFDKPTIYTPRQLRGVIMDGNVFISRIVDLPVYTYQTFTVFSGTGPQQYLTRDLEKGLIKDTVFLQQLVRGSVNLYRMKNKEGFAYFFGEKDGVFKEIPPIYYLSLADSLNASEYQNTRLINKNTIFNVINTTIKHYGYLDTLFYFLKDEAIYNQSKKIKANEKTYKGLISFYNKKKGISNGGVLKDKVSRKIFTGISAGFLTLTYDPIINDAKLTNTLAFKAYGLYPMMGVNKNVFAKFAFNYYRYADSQNEKAIPSGTFGLRYSAIKGAFRPYIEGNLGVSALIRNNRPIDFGFPFILEFGGIIPVKNYFLTLGVNHSPVMLYKLNGYKLWSYQIGILF